MPDVLKVFYFPLLGTPTAPLNELSFYVAGTDQNLNVYSDVSGDTPWAQPIIFNAAGNPDGIIYVDPDTAYKVVYEDPNGVAIPGYPVDFIPPGEILNVTTTSITTLTNAQIKALPTTPITLVAAPGSGAFVHVFGVTLVLNSVAGAYTNINATYATLEFTNYSALSVVKDSGDGVTTLDDFLGAADTQLILTGVPYLRQGGSYINNFVAGVTAYDGAAFRISGDNNGSGNWTGGHADNTMTVTVTYALEVLP